MDEPSLLDLLKEKLNPRTWFIRHPVESSAQESSLPHPAGSHRERTSSEHITIPWKALAAVLLAIAGQMALDPAKNNFIAGVLLFAASIGVLLRSIRLGEWQMLPENPEDATAQAIPLTVKRIPFIIFLISLLLAFLTLGGNRFTLFNVFWWLASLVSGVSAFWISEKKPDFQQIRDKVLGFFRNPITYIRLNPWNLLVLAVFSLAMFFHLHQLDVLPYDMTSDHAEKLLDINQILNGNPMIFFFGNGGREPMHFYLAALLVKVFHTGMDFFTLKLAMALAFLGSLVYVYYLGKEIGTRWTGLFFMLFMGYAAWPNIIAHSGMRLVLTPVFLAPTLFYFFRGLRRSSRNDLILTGVFLGLGMLGYTASRIVPVVLIVGMVIFLAYHRFNKSSRSTTWGFLLTALFAFVVFLPIIRYALEDPFYFNERALSRVTSSEVPLPDNLILVFLENVWKALIMPFWKSGTAWVISVPDQPALDTFTAAFLLLGLIATIVHWLKNRSWRDLFLMLSIPLLMLPSTLALAFPIENPSQSRAGGAMLPIFLISAIGFETLLRTFWVKARQYGYKVVIVLIALALIISSARSNFDFALVKYPEIFASSTWNTREMGVVVKDFTRSFGTIDNAWIVAKAYWVDTRLVAMTAGYVDRDLQVWPDDLERTLANPGAKLFIVKADDVDGMTRLRTLYPDGYATYHQSPLQDRDFIVYLVKPEPAE